MSALLDRALAGESIAIAKPGDAPVRLAPLRRKRFGSRPIGGAKGELWMSDDFDEPVEELEDLAT